MTTEEAKRIIDSLRRWGRWRRLPESDVALLRSQIEANEGVSFMLGAMLMGTLARQRDLSWWDLWLLAGFAFVGYCRWEIVRYRRALRLFEEQGPQRIEELQHVHDNAEPSDEPNGAPRRRLS